MNTTDQTPTIYIASKTIHAPRWRALRAAGARIISTWIDEAEPGESSDLGDLWTRCIGEASSAAVCIVYAEPGEVLRGALVEAGAALASGREVRWVGEWASTTLMHHPRVKVFDTVEDAIAAPIASQPPIDRAAITAHVVATMPLLTDAGMGELRIALDDIARRHPRALTSATLADERHARDAAPMLGGLLHLRGALDSTRCGLIAARVCCANDVEMFGRVARGEEPGWSGPTTICVGCARHAADCPSCTAALGSSSPCAISHDFGPGAYPPPTLTHAAAIDAAADRRDAPRSTVGALFGGISHTFRPPAEMAVTFEDEPPSNAAHLGEAPEAERAWREWAVSVGAVEPTSSDGGHPGCSACDAANARVEAAR